MFSSDLRRQKVSQYCQKESTCIKQSFDPYQSGHDDQLVADCRTFIWQVSNLLDGIRHAADLRGWAYEYSQAVLCEADEQAFGLARRIVVTRATTHRGIQSKHAIAEFLLSIEWHDEPSPYRDELLLSLVLDAARLSYPNPPRSHASVCEDLDTTTAVVVQANTCITVLKELSASFARKDLNASPGWADQENLDTSILALMDEKKIAIKALISVRALSVYAIHAKRLVLRRMLEASMTDSDAHCLRVELARSYISELSAFCCSNAQKYELLSTRNAIWESFPAVTAG